MAQDTTAYNDLRAQAVLDAELADRTLFSRHQQCNPGNDEILTDALLAAGYNAGFVQGFDSHLEDQQPISWFSDDESDADGIDHTPMQDAEERLPQLWKDSGIGSDSSDAGYSEHAGDASRGRDPDYFSEQPWLGASFSDLLIITRAGGHAQRRRRHPERVELAVAAEIETRSEACEQGLKRWIWRMRSWLFR